MAVSSDGVVLAGRPVGQEWNGALGGEEPVGGPGDLVGRQASADITSDPLDHVAAGEGRSLLGHAVRSTQPVEERVDLGVGERSRR